MVSRVQMTRQPCGIHKYFWQSTD